MAELVLDRVAKTFPGDVRAVQDLALRVEDGELLVLLGPSGCGKSTVLRLVAGLESLTEGEIRIGDRRVDHLPPDRRDVAMVFQNYALYGHMSVRGNMEFPLKMRGVDAAERRRRAEEAAELLELTELLDKKPAALSGGQQQRVAMGRALVREPEAFLLDEPLSNLDARLRTQVRGEIGRLQRRLGITTIHVTHDQIEALALGDRIAVLRRGRLQQVGTGRELFDRPINTFVASFLGDPGMNLLAGRTAGGEGGAAVELEGCDVRVPLEASERSELLEDRVVVGIRPEDLSIEHVGTAREDDGGSSLDGRPAPRGGGSVRSTSGGPTIESTIREIEVRGHDAIVHVEPECRVLAPPDAPEDAPGRLSVRTGPTNGHDPGDRVRVRLSAASTIRLFDGDGRALDPG